MADERYAHQFEDLNGQPDEATTEVDVDSEPEPLDSAPAREATDHDADHDAREPGSEPGSDDDNAPDADALNAKIDDALAQQQSSARDSEIETLRAEVAELRNQRTADEGQAEQAKADQEIATTRARLREAQEEGDTDAAVEAQEKLVDLQVSRAMRGQPTDPNPPNNQPAHQGPPAMPAAAQSWITRNPWFAQGSDPEAARAALVIEQQLRGAGYDVESDALYSEIDRQLARRKPAARKRSPAPTNGMGSQAAPARGSRVQITRDDRESMATFGLDPDNPAHLKAWAKEKRSQSTGSRA